MIFTKLLYNLMKIMYIFIKSIIFLKRKNFANCMMNKQFIKNINCLALNAHHAIKLIIQFLNAILFNISLKKKQLYNNILMKIIKYKDKVQIDVKLKGQMLYYHLVF